MKTLIIYDLTGRIFTLLDEPTNEPIGIPFLWDTIPKGKYVTSVDVSVIPNAPVLCDLPKSETQLLEEKMDLMQSALDDLILAGGTL